MDIKLDFSRVDSIANSAASASDMAPEFTYEDAPETILADKTKADFVLVPAQTMQRVAEIKGAILSDIRTGEPPYRLLLQAAEALALISNDDDFMLSVKWAVVNIHGEALGRDVPKDWLIESYQHDQIKLEEVLAMEPKHSKRRDTLEASLLEVKETIAKLKEGGRQ